GDAVAFQRFLCGPKDIFFPLHIDKNDPVGINTEALERGRIDTPRIAHPHTNSAAAQKRLHNAGDKTADSRRKFRTRADKFMQCTGWKDLIRKAPFYTPKSKVLPLTRRQRTEALP